MEFLNPKGLVAPPKSVSQGVKIKAGSLIAVSGQLPINFKGEIVGKGDIKAQTDQVLKNIELVLKEAGANLDNVFKLTIFITDISKIGEVLEVRQKYFKNNFPAASAFEVKSLVNKEALVEIEALATL